MNIKEKKNYLKEKWQKIATINLQAIGQCAWWMQARELVCLYYFIQRFPSLSLFILNFSVSTTQIHILVYINPMHIQFVQAHFFRNTVLFNSTISNDWQGSCHESNNISKMCWEIGREIFRFLHNIIKEQKIIENCEEIGRRVTRLC